MCIFVKFIAWYFNSLNHRENIDTSPQSCESGGAPVCNISIYFGMLFGYSCCIYFVEMILILPLKLKRCFVHMCCKAQPFSWYLHAYTNTYQLSVNITIGSSSRGKNGYLVWRRQIWLESTSLRGNFFLGTSGALLDSKTTELGFSQRTTANHVVWTTFGTLLVAPNNITYPSWLKRFLRATYEMWGVLWKYKELFKSKESGLKWWAIWKMQNCI